MHVRGDITVVEADDILFQFPELSGESAYLIHVDRLAAQDDKVMLQKQVEYFLCRLWRERLVCLETRYFDAEAIR